MTNPPTSQAHITSLMIAQGGKVYLPDVADVVHGQHVLRLHLAEQRLHPRTTTSACQVVINSGKHAVAAKAATARIH